MVPVHRTPLRGREDQLSEALTVLRTAATDGLAGALIVRGAAGAGKTRLLKSIGGAAAGLGFRVLEGSGDVDAATMPMAPLLQAVLGGTPPLMDRRSVQDAMRTGEARYVLIEEITDALEQAARSQPLLVAIDDVQFSDPTTLFALRVMAERLAGEPLVWSITTRDPVREDAVARTIDRLERLNVVSLTASPLSPGAVTQVAEDLLGATLDANLRSIVERAGGQVLDLVETLRGLIDEGRIDIVDGHAGLADTTVPTRLRDSVNRRLARLPPGAAEIVAAGTAVGRRFSAPVVARLLDRTVDEVRAGLHAAEGAQLVVTVDGDVAFRHDLIREAIELTLSPDARRELRRAAVDVQLNAGVSVLEVATTLAASAVSGDEHAAQLLEQAAGEVALVDPSTGADLVGRAADIVTDDPARRGRLLAQRVMLLWQAGRGADARLIGEQALMAGLGPTQEAEVRLGLALVTSEHSYPEAGRQAAVALALPGLTDAVRTKLLAAQCVTKIMVNDFTNLDEDLTTALRLARSSGDRASESSVLATRSTLSFHQMDWTAAFEQAEQGRLAADDVAHPTSMWAPKSIWQAILLSTTGSPGEALRIVDDGIAEATAAGQGAAMSLWMMIRCRALLEAGRLSDAQAEAETVLTITDWRERSTMAEYTVNFVLRRVAQYAGDPAALRRTQSGAARMTRDEVSSVRRQGKWLAALDADTDGHPDLAIELTAEGVDGYGGLGNALSLDPADEPLYARIAARARRPDLASRAADFTERRAARNPGQVFLQAIARHTRGLVDDDPDALSEATALFAGTERPLPRAAALEDAGRVEADRDTAITLLDQAHDIYATTGAMRDAARTRQRLRGLGIRRRQPRQDADGDRLADLTPSELAVVELVARGATNREVAAQLFLSPHTVSTHLRHAFTKVGVRSRVELARLATLTEDRRAP